MLGPSDPLAWAKYPRSFEAMQAVREGAKKSRRLRAIYEEHVASGVCDKDGKLLLIWDGAIWQPFRARR